MLKLISRALSKDRAVPLDHTLIGGVQPIWLVGPCRPRYKKRERDWGTTLKVHRRHNSLPLPCRSKVSARPTESATTSLPMAAAGSAPPQPRLPRRHWSNGAPELILAHSTRRRWSAPPLTSLSLCLYLSIVVDQGTTLVILLRI
jgi:hypothetical protein